VPDSANEHAAFCTGVEATEVGTADSFRNGTTQSPEKCAVVIIVTSTPSGPPLNKLLPDLEIQIHRFLLRKGACVTRITSQPQDYPHQLSVGGKASWDHCISQPTISSIHQHPSIENQTIADYSNFEGDSGLHCSTMALHGVFSADLLGDGVGISRLSEW
jgi:hypothetical protein